MLHVAVVLVERWERPEDAEERLEEGDIDDLAGAFVSGCGFAEFS